MMKAIQPNGLRALCAASALVLGCMSDAEREMVRVDGEIFEAVARSQALPQLPQSRMVPVEVSQPSVLGGAARQSAKPARQV